MSCRDSRTEPPADNSDNESEDDDDDNYSEPSVPSVREKEQEEDDEDAFGLLFENVDEDERADLQGDKIACQR